ncbi:immunoglobulin superfamily member 6 isoform X2 [Octodon degus]|uniref:immunoglobulin superfamily member 6 isoform X2 n=1 Tax=Octodon degus TaxID=10160 RepID=UPI000C9F4AC4|nr:immunoglobulin superfamily member 6 isoform X2 [Octodon degus]
MRPASRSETTLGLEINLILFYIGAAGACAVSVTQPGYLEVDGGTDKAVTIECRFTAAGCPSQPPQSLWFRYRTHQAEHLCSGSCTGEADKFMVQKALEQNRVSLTVNRVTPNDSAIYICGIAFPTAGTPGAKQAGGGTTLVVRDGGLLSQELHSVLTALLVLLSVYIIGLCAIFGVLSKKKSARRIFQEIAQELYHKRHVEASQQPEKDNTYENRRALSNYKRP